MGGGEDGGGEGKTGLFSFGRGVREGVRREGSRCVFLPDCRGLRDSTKEFGVVFVRQWVDWKDSELEQWWQLGRLNFTAVS